MTERPNHVAEAMETAASADAQSVAPDAVVPDAVGSLAAEASQSVKPDSSHTLKVVRFESLARCGDEIWIENEGQIYRLRRTRQGKLILTK
ncbi:hemin uptake protein HemP [Neorhodopirellula pilleata]|nr:hemin uptake protein HemP [Neorhodopirellula pilleata]